MHTQKTKHKSQEEREEAPQGHSQDVLRTRAHAAGAVHAFAPSSHLAGLARLHTVRRRVLAALAVLSFVVALAVVWQLKLTGISMTDEAFCGKPEHVHTDACVTHTLTCAQEEHAHSTEADCYATQRALVCGQEEHTHSVEDGCYDVDGNLVCDRLEHTHTDACYADEQVLTCDKPEHAHTDACYETAYTCGLEEHVHTPQCYSNVNADLETSEDWEASLPALTGASADDLVAVAVSQLGMSESVQNFQVADDGTTRRGYSRYGAWYGNPYGAWSAMFVDFCLSYAGNAAAGTLANSGANAMLFQAQQAGLFHSAEEGAQGLAQAMAPSEQQATQADMGEDVGEGGQGAALAGTAAFVPRAGDVLFLDEDGDGQADAAAVIEATDASSSVLHAIQGDSNVQGVEGQADRVERVVYAASDARILGYAKLPRTVDGEPDPADEEAGLGPSDAANDTAGNGADVAEDTDDGIAVAALQPSGTKTVNCYAIVNGEHTKFASKQVTCYLQGKVPYINAADLEDVYGALGFTASQLTDASIAFPFANGVDSKRDDYWIDCPTVVDGDTCYVPLTKESATNLCYLPTSGASAATYMGTFDTDASGCEIDGPKFTGTRPSTLLEKAPDGDRFYTVTVPDEGADAAGIHYVCGDAGADALSVTLPSPKAGMMWQLRDADGAVVDPTQDANVSLTTSDDATTYTYTFSNVARAYAFELVSDQQGVTVVYDLNLTGTYNAADAPKVYGIDGYTETLPVQAQASYVLPAPSPRSYSYTLASDPLTHRATFSSWSVLVGGRVVEEGLQPGASIDLSQYAGRTVTLRANWDDAVLGTVRCYAFVDDARVLLGTRQVEWRLASEGQRDRYYVKASDLDAILEAYGITEHATSADGTLYYLMGRPSGSDTNLWADTSARTIDGEVYVPAFLKDTVTAASLATGDVYYLPVSGSSSGAFEDAYGKLKVSPADMLDSKKDMLYSVTVHDYDATVYPKDQVRYVPVGTTGYACAVSNYAAGAGGQAQAVSWQCAPADGVTSEVSADGMTTTFTIGTPGAPVSSSYRITRAAQGADCSVVYDLNMGDVTIDGVTYRADYNAFSVPTGVVDADGDVVLGQMVPGEGLMSYAVLQLDRDAYTFRLAGVVGQADFSADKRLCRAVFCGWNVQVDGQFVGEDGTLLPVGDTEGAKKLVAAASTLDLSAYAGKTVHLVAAWDYERTGEGHTESSYVNFYVSLAALPEGTAEFDPSFEEEKFTDSLYLADCGVRASDVSKMPEENKGDVWETKASRYEHRAVIGDISGNTVPLAKAGDRVRNELTAGFTRTAADGTTYAFQMDFPGDEQVLAQIRSLVESGAQTITLNGRTVGVADLTSDNFTIEWYVFKTSKTDGWHVDGVLIAKTSSVKVTKTFAGSSAAIEQVLAGGGNYQIVVTARKKDGTAQDTATHTRCTLVPKDADDPETHLSEGELGYSSVSRSDDGSITYTWDVPIDQYYTYQLEERNYVSDAANAVTHARYTVQNSGDPTDNTDGWANYVAGEAVSVTPYVTGYGGGNSERLAVNFLNTYVPVGTVAIEKLDMATQADLPGVSFTLTKEGDPDFQVALIDGVYYAKGARDSEGEAIDPDEEGSYANAATANEAGHIYLYVQPGVYRLRENVPDGYRDPGEITLTLTDDGSGSWSAGLVGSASAAGGAMYATVATNDEGKQALAQVRNCPKTVTVRVTKVWSDGENTPVTLQLFRRERQADGTYASVAVSGCTSTLDGVGADGWTCAWTDVPLCAQGQPASYFVRETAVGATAYSSEYSDGYKYYTVIYGNAVLRTADGAQTSDLAQTAEIDFTVTNARDDGVLAFDKVDEAGRALGGATFALYDEKDVRQVVGDAFDATRLGVARAADGSCALTYDGGALDVAPAKTVTSDEGGRVLFGRSVTSGTYYLLETSAPEGYGADGSLYRLVYYDPGYAAYRLADGAWQDATLNNQIVNERLCAGVTLRKTDGQGNALAGATFRLMARGEDGVYSTANVAASVGVASGTAVAGQLQTYRVSDVGEIAFRDLPEGRYCLEESQAPDGYYRLLSRVYLKVEDGVPSLDFDAASAEGLDVSAQGQCSLAGDAVGGYTLAVTNVSGTRLPSTGGPGGLPYVLTGGLLATAAMAMLWFRMCPRGPGKERK